jgi:hypothetical protein
MTEDCKRKGPDRTAACPPADTNYASDRTADVMYELGLFRESMGFTPIPEAAPYRRPELRPMNPVQEYVVRD